MSIYVGEESFWVARGRQKVSMLTPPPPPPPPDPEWPPVLGSYRPGSSTTGPRPELGTLDRYDGDIRLTTSDQVIEGLEIYGRIIHQTGVLDPVVRNCIVRGPGAAYTSTAQTGLIVPPSDFDHRGLVIEDTRLDATGRENVYIDGLRGGRYTARRVEIAGVQDGVSLLPQIGLQVLEGCWIHNGAYFEWLAGQVNSPSSDNQTHNDGVQFHRGKGIRIRGCNLGGYRDPNTPRKPAPYTTLDAVRTAAIRANDDYNNACIMLKQEVSSSLADKIDDVIIEMNWFEGGISGINIAVTNGNDLSGVIVRNNRFIRTTELNKWYILKPDTAMLTLEGNVFDDDGSPVTIKRG